ncbi:hypothetical protein H5410_040937 [Solanum commersonii]|uniref:Uncharacterized protein n=1 Tax=Solanum commersonii TaxID=4109 RepID=A0A9J5XS94_SOLCO|nr:hypothetical protein H5410_040937 [Solanum commersonii]
MLLQITYQDKATQTDLDNENTIEKILNAMTLFHTKLDTMEKELQQIKSQQHDAKHAELKLEGDDGKHRKTQTNSLLNAATGTASTNANLVGTCYHYGLLNTVYTATRDKIATIPELHKAFMHYKRITKGTLFYIKFYSAPAEILYDEIKPIIQVIKIGLTREMIIPKKIEKQNEIQKIEILEFYARKRVIGRATILNELATNYVNGNTIWSYYAREQTMLYSNCRETRPADMEEIRQ